MATPLAKRIEPFAVEGGLKGQLSALPLPEILQYLQVAKANGVLTVSHGGARKSLYVKDGRVVFASSNLPNDRLGEILLREGKITVEEYEASIRAIAKGKRQGKALVEMGALSPKDLWAGVQFQVREIVYPTFQWDEGDFHFEASDAPAKERITVDLDIEELILAGLRRVDANGAIQGLYPDGHTVLELCPGEPPALEPYEQHVLHLVDGERSVVEVCRESEIGDNETLKVLYALGCVGVVRAKGRKVHALDQDFVPEDTLFSVLSSFNDMYAQLYRHMVQEVGPIAENVLEKYVSGLREQRKDVFAGVKLQKDGTLDAAVVERNLNKFSEDERRSRLVDALNELLYAELLAVKRTLGAEHEATIIKALREQQA
jgi:Domain of unknown function (DUF4388)